MCGGLEFLGYGVMSVVSVRIDRLDEEVVCLCALFVLESGLLKDIDGHVVLEGRCEDGGVMCPGSRHPREH